MARLTHPQVLETVPIGNLVYVVLDIPATSFTLSQNDLVFNALLSEIGIAEVFGASMLINTDGYESFKINACNDGSDSKLVIAVRPSITSNATSYPLSPHQNNPLKRLVGNITNNDSRVIITQGSEHIDPNGGQVVISTDYNGGEPVKINAYNGNQQRAFLASSATQTASSVEFLIGDKIDNTNTLSVSTNIPNIPTTYNSVSGILTLIGRRG